MRRLSTKELAERPNRTSGTGTAHFGQQCIQVLRNKVLWDQEIRSHTALGRARYQPWYSLLIERWQPMSRGLQPHPSGPLTTPLLCDHMLQSTAESGYASPTRQP